MTTPDPRAHAPVPRPLLLAAGRHTCAAWWHEPAPAQAVPALAVVLASSWGEDDMSAYDGLRVLACRLAETGLATLRFEWPDTGDSSAATGDADVPDLLAAFEAAAATASAWSGGARLAFVGLRLGALLAAHAAAGRQDVDAFVGLLPVASGRAFVREQRLLGSRFGTQPGAEAPGAPTRLGGFGLPAARAAAFDALAWPAAVAAPPREALLVSAPDLPARAAAEALGRLGVRVRESSHADVAAMLAIAHQARLAPAVIDEIVQWLQARAAEAAVGAANPRVPAAGSACGAGPWLHVDAGGIGVRERLVVIAEPDDTAEGIDAPRLAGVLVERDLPVQAGEASPSARRGIVLLSSGRERRVGPHRIWVPFARHRAACGDVVLRLDIAGIGDSAARARPDPQGIHDLYDPRCVDDLARAIAWLRREHGVRDCAVMGVCSGAYHAWRAALAGVDVQRIVLVNPVVFHWRAGLSLDPETHAFGQIGITADARRAMRDPRRWLKLLRGQVHTRVILRAFAGRARHALRLRVRELARALGMRLRDDLAAELAQVSRRGVALDFVFSAREAGLPLLRQESGRRGTRLERDGRMRVHEIEHADHTFAGPAGRLGFYARLDELLDLAPVTPPAPITQPSRETATARS